MNGEHAGTAGDVGDGEIGAVHQVRAQLERSLTVGTGERVVDSYQDVAGVGDPRDFGNVDQLHQRIGRAFEPDQSRLIGDRVHNVLCARCIDKRET